jgi:hypothetical protein
VTWPGAANQVPCWATTGAAWPGERQLVKIDIQIGAVESMAAVEAHDLALELDHGVAATVAGKAAVPRCRHLRGFGDLKACLIGRPLVFHINLPSKGSA